MDYGVIKLSVGKRIEEVGALKMPRHFVGWAEYTPSQRQVLVADRAGLLDLMLHYEQGS